MTLPFTLTSQELLIAHALKGHKSAKLIVTLVEPEEWADDNCKMIWKAVLEYHKVYKQIPSRQELIEVLPPDTITMLDHLYKLKDADKVPALVDLLISYTKTAEVEALIEEAKKYSVKDPDKAKEILRNGSSRQLIANYEFHNLEDIFTDYILDVNNNEAKLPTGLRHLDKALGGGMQQRELMVVVAPSGAGKSSILAYMCGTMSLFTNCLFISIELTMDRMAQLLVTRITKYTQDQVTPRMETCDVINARNIISARMSTYVEKYESYHLSVAEIAGMIDALKYVENKRIGAVFIDYTNLLLASHEKNLKEYEKVAILMQQLEDLSRRYNVAVISAAHTTTEGGDDEVQREMYDKDIAGGRATGRKADIILGFKPFYTDEDLHITKGVLSYIKTRRVARPSPWVMMIDWDSMKLTYVHKFVPVKEKAKKLLGSGNAILEPDNTENGIGYA